MKLSLEIKMDNDAFVNHNGYQCAAILDALCIRLRSNILGDGDRMTMHDVNGNNIGVAVVSDEE